MRTQCTRQLINSYTHMYMHGQSQNNGKKLSYSGNKPFSYTTEMSTSVFNCVCKSVTNHNKQHSDILTLLIFALDRLCSWPTANGQE